MAVDIVVPALGESVTEATVAKWMKAAGDAVQRDEALLELETDKVTLEVYAAQAGVLREIRVPAGATVEVGAVLGSIGDSGGASGAKSPASAPAPAKPAQAPKVAEAPALAPAVRKLVEENKLEIAAIPASGKDGRLTKADVITHIGTGVAAPAPAMPIAAAPVPPRAPRAREERVRMTRLRKRIAERLKQAQNTAAILTTYNEADMSAVMGLRQRLKAAFEAKHGVKLGMMSFFVKACIVALKEIPAVNAEIDGDDIIYKNYYDIGVAVGTGQGLVVPVVRDCDALDFAGIEKKIAELGQRARDGKLTIDDLTGGTFTISNGGVYGSMMSMPILNPPQSGILGMHNIMQRPVAIEGRVEIRPMMYLALSYDHRIIDGREAVTFLIRVKECIEAPERLLLEV